jgi:hypothetical protein
VEVAFYVEVDRQSTLEYGGCALEARDTAMGSASDRWSTALIRTRPVIPRPIGSEPIQRVVGNVMGWTVDAVGWKTGVVLGPP